MWLVQQVVLTEGRDSHTHPKSRRESTISAATFGDAPFMPVMKTHLLRRQRDNNERLELKRLSHESLLGELATSKR